MIVVLIQYVCAVTDTTHTVVDDIIHGQTGRVEWICWAAVQMCLLMA